MHVPKCNERNVVFSTKKCCKNASQNKKAALKNSLFLSKMRTKTAFSHNSENSYKYFYSRKKRKINRKIRFLIKVSQGIHKAVKNDYNVNVSDLFIGS